MNCKGTWVSRSRKYKEKKVLINKYTFPLNITLTSPNPTNLDFNFLLLFLSRSELRATLKFISQSLIAAKLKIKKLK